MSDYTAIAGVSRSLRNLLTNRMEDPVDVTIAPPDVAISGIIGRRLNLYLYEVNKCAFLANQEIPGHGHQGAYGHPPLSLYMHYLLTAYGENETNADADLSAQLILGDAMRVFHDFAIITPNLHDDDDLAKPHILDASLLGEFEKVKITLQSMSMEDLSNIWTALPQANLRRSVVYRVSIVQIESQRPRRFPRPVGEPPPAGPRIYAVPFQRPHIDEIHVRRLGDPPGTERTYPYARIGDELIVRGYNFASEATRVIVGGLDIPVTPLADNRIEFVLPDHTLPNGVTVSEERRLQPGPQTVEVLTGVTAIPQAGFSSNPAVFMLVPRVDSQTPDWITVPRALTITGNRLVGEFEPGETIIGNAVISKTDYEIAEPTQIRVPLPDTLPAWPVQCLLSGDLSIFPSLVGPLEMQMTIGSDGPHTTTLGATPHTLEEAAVELQSAIRNAPGGGPAFRDARVTVTHVDQQLVIVPGGVGSLVTVTITGAIADQLRLSGSHGATQPQVALSGALVPYPTLTAEEPAFDLTIGGTTYTITLPGRPMTPADTASMVETVVRGVGPEAAFSNAQVTALGHQLLFVPGDTGDVLFGTVAGSDETTASELQLHTHYRVRVRVNGAESLDDIFVELPS